MGLDRRLLQIGQHILGGSPRRENPGRGGFSFSSVPRPSVPRQRRRNARPGFHHRQGTCSRRAVCRNVRPMLIVLRVCSGWELADVVLAINFSKVAEGLGDRAT